MIGAGAIGGRIAAHLATSGCRVRIVDADQEHVAAIRSEGLLLAHPDGAVERIPLEAAGPDECDVHPLTSVILATKAHRTAAAVAWAAERLARDGLVLVCQNGQGHRRIADRLGSGRVVPSLINFAADRVAPGIIRLGGQGSFAVGEVDGTASPRVARLAEDFAGFPGFRTSANIVGLLWSKAVLGVLLTATALVDDDMIPTIERHRGAMAALAGEVIALAGAARAELEPIDGIDWRATPHAAIDDVLNYLRTMTGKTRSGVFRDLRAGRVPTEASAELEDLLLAASAASLESPALTALRQALGSIETGSLPLGHTHLAQVALRAHTSIERRT
ncbi:NAD-binding protein [Leucobacter allii]|uniref:ketopantoate reductase family protein n=1 Tax=Leucobacter allii TaxID=2932247 RepID=UPI001FD04B04|nr:2-dehydropantoate 2-reductase N-terminal domain-containing protein [Leucobacter allii]UOR01535.1 NAD-binding protein [Leucobacter allii]